MKIEKTHLCNCININGFIPDMIICADDNRRIDGVFRDRNCLSDRAHNFWSIGGWFITLSRIRFRREIPGKMLLYF